MGLHFILQHLDRPGTYVRILFVDFSTAFNTLIPDTFQNKLTQLSVPTSVCQSVTILQDLKWDTHIEPIVKKAQQRLYFLRQLRKFNLPQELLIQFFSAIIESVLCTSITVWFSSATKSDLRRLRRVVRTADRIIGTTLPAPRTVLIQSEQKGCWQNHSGPLTSSTLPLWTVTIWSTLQSSEHQNNQTQEQFLSPSNPSHEHLTLNVEHTHHYYKIIYSPHILFHFKFARQTCTQNCVYCILCFCYFVHCLFFIFVYCSVVVCVLSYCCHSVELWSFCHYNKFLVCANILGQ